MQCLKVPAGTVTSSSTAVIFIASVKRTDSWCRKRSRKGTARSRMNGWLGCSQLSPSFGAIGSTVRATASSRGSSSTVVLSALRTMLPPSSFSQYSVPRLLRRSQ